MTAEKLDAILARQMPDEEKRGRADFVIDTGGDLSTTERQVGDILSCLGLGARWIERSCGKSSSIPKPPG